MTILIVEDNLMNVKFMKVVLTKKGNYTVLVSEDVFEILKIAREVPLECIIMDIGLANSYYEGKHVDGVDITRLLKADEATRHIPVLLATAHAMAGDRERLLNESGADGYVSKPLIDPQAFLETVQKVIKH